MPDHCPPGAIGLYDPAHEHDSCGVAFVAKLDGASHKVVERALAALANLEHRGAQGADSNTGDGAGILVQLPDEFLRAVAPAELPPLYGVAMCFLPRDEDKRADLERQLEEIVAAEGQSAL